MSAPALELHHVAIIVTDLERSSAFYRALFGFAPIARPPFTIPGQWLGVGPLAIHLTVYPKGSFRTRGVDNDDSHFALRTNDFEAFVAHAEAMGFRAEAPEGDPMRMIVKRQGLAGFPQCFVCDPDRNTIEVNGAPE